MKGHYPSWVLYLPLEKALYQQVFLESKKRVKKQVTVLATSIPKTVAKKKAVGENPRFNLARVLCIHYPINFRKKSMLVLFDWGSKVNAVYPTFAKELGLPIKLTDVEMQKINAITLDTYRMVVTTFLVKDKANQVKFLEETFLIANIGPEVVFRMPFFTLSRADVDFLGWELRWRTYTTEKAFLSIRDVELVGKKNLQLQLDLEHEIYVVHIKSISFDPLLSFFLFDVYPS